MFDGSDLLLDPRGGTCEPPCKRTHSLTHTLTAAREDIHTGSDSVGSLFDHRTERKRKSVVDVCVYADSLFGLVCVCGCACDERKGKSRSVLNSVVDVHNSYNSRFNTKKACVFIR